MKWTMLTSEFSTNARKHIDVVSHSAPFPNQVDCERDRAAVGFDGGIGRVGVIGGRRLVVLMALLYLDDPERC